MVAPRNQYGSILVVEDGALDALTDLLEASGYNVRRAQNGQEALVRAKGRPPSMILPRFVDAGNGWLGIYAPAAIGAGDREIPVVVITALVSAVPASAKALVTKPVDVNRLMSLVQKYCTYQS
jgi:CheY-like chemotaxis protein